MWKILYQNIILLKRNLYTYFYKVNKEKAMETYNKYKSCYHPIAVKYVDAALKKVKIEDE